MTTRFSASTSNKPQFYYSYGRSEMLEFVRHDARTALDVGCTAGGARLIELRRIGGNKALLGKAA